MLNIETAMISTNTWKIGIENMLGFDESLATNELVPELMKDDYESYIDYIIDSVDSLRLQPYLAIIHILSDIKDLYEARGYTTEYKIEPVDTDSYIVVIAYQS